LSTFITLQNTNNLLKTVISLLTLIIIELAAILIAIT
jgi:hypothetical protein